MRVGWVSAFRVVFLKHDQEISDKRIIKGLATAGLIGNIVKTNGSISGAEVGMSGRAGNGLRYGSGGRPRYWEVP